MNLLVIYADLLAINYNKNLIIKSFLKNKKFYKENNINLEVMKIDDINDFINNINLNNYKNYILWLHQKIGSFILTFPEKVIQLKSLNIKTIFWMDDLHYPCLNLSMEDRLDKSIIDKDCRYINCDYIVSPSIDYFYNIKSNLIDKSKFLFYFFDEEIIDNFNPTNYDDRISKILLSGKINSLSYKTRKEMYEFYCHNKDIVDYLEHPGYKNLKHEFYHYNYYNKLSKYKGAFLGLGNYPVNFLLGKVVEILGSGCLGFFEESNLYKDRLGLIENVHYISIKKNEGNLILSNKDIINLLNNNKGKSIAINGYNFIKKNYNSQSFSQKIIEIIKLFNIYI